MNGNHTGRLSNPSYYAKSLAGFLACLIGLIVVLIEARLFREARLLNVEEEIAHPNVRSQIHFYDTSLKIYENKKSNVSAIEPRVFPSWPFNQSLPCFPAEKNWYEWSLQKTPADQGFFFLKPYKTGSSTSSGINIRIARNVARRQSKNFDVCKTRFDHGPDMSPGKTLFGKRSHKNSVLWTIIRDPTKRAISAFFHFQVSRHKIDPTDENFQSYMQAQLHPIQDYYLKALFTKGNFKRTTHNPIEVSNDILKEFDFIGITERMEESFVALMMLFNLRLADILYLSAKTSGGYDDAGGGKGCTFIKPSFVSAGMATFFASNEWKDMIKYDLALYTAVNKSLDLTIEKIGRDLFETNLSRFRYAQAEAQSKCLPTTIFRCDRNGNFHPPNETDCLWRDSGCGTTCLDEVASNLGLW